MILQNRKWCHCVPRLLANLIRENKMVAICRASKYITVFHGVEHYDYGSTATTKRRSYSVRFFRLLCSQTGRMRRNLNCSNYEKFEESYWSYAQEIYLIGHLHQLLGILNELRCHGKVGRPRLIPCKVSNCSQASANRGLPTSPFLIIITIAWAADSSKQSISLSDSFAVPWKWHCTARSRCQVTGVGSLLS